uniref:Uncharacterized protein n=1 Tax=Peronospora matthiolae TaxID=2874970 RepID=A0AAV1SY42_9STRA
MTGHDGSKVVRVCLTRCPLPSADGRVHSLPCRIHHDGAAAVATFFCPRNQRDDRSDGTDEDCLEVEMREENQVDGEADSNGQVAVGGTPLMTAEFRGVQLQGQKLLLAPLGLTGLVLGDSGMRHEDDEGRIWEVEDHFDELTWWDVPHNTTRETHQLPLVLHQWHDLSAAIHGA